MKLFNDVVVSKAFLGSLAVIMLSAGVAKDQSPKTTHNHLYLELCNSSISELTMGNDIVDSVQDIISKMLIQVNSASKILTGINQ